MPTNEEIEKLANILFKAFNTAKTASVYDNHTRWLAVSIYVHRLIRIERLRAPEKMEGIYNIALASPEYQKGFNDGFNSCIDIISSTEIEVDENKFIELLQDINFESYGFSHESVANKTAKAISAALPKLIKVAGK